MLKDRIEDCGREMQEYRIRLDSERMRMIDVCAYFISIPSDLNVILGSWKNKEAGRTRRYLRRNDW